ncbi:MAG: NAD(P)H-hydrate dehydratase [bacterium]
MQISTKEPKAIGDLLKNLKLPKINAHKGDNGKVLIIGGSKLFHSASIWGAEVASHVVDMVHYSSTKENNEILTSVKKKFLNGIVIQREDIPKYIKEDDSVLIGPGMVRGEKKEINNLNFREVLNLKNESNFTRQLVNYLICKFPDKKYVFDAGALQMMDKEWLLKLDVAPILTPHEIEFETLFGIKTKGKKEAEKVEIIEQTSKKFNCVILFKNVKDIVSDGNKTYVIDGGNAGLAKGGSGDVLASLSCSFYTRNNALISAVLSSYIVKKTADDLFLKQGYWYNISNLVDSIPYTLKKLI